MADQVRQVTRRSAQLTPLAVLLILTAGGMLFFWLQSGMRGLIVLAVALVVAEIIDGVWSFASLRNPQLDVHCPADAVVGDPMAVAVRVHGLSRPALLTMLSVPGSPSVRVFPPASGVLEVVPLVSGRFPWGIFEISVHGPLGLVGCVRRLVVQLDQAVLVAPRFVEHDVTFPTSSGSRAGHTRGAATQLDLVRSVREYVPSDGSRLIHWAATARTGQLMVKELDPAGAGHLTIVLDLHKEDPGAEAASGRAGYLAQRALREGWTVRLINRESLDTTDQVMPRLTGNRLPIRLVKRPAGSSATVFGHVTSSRDAGRRLAAVDFGPPDLPARDGSLVRLVCSSGDDRWL